MNPKGVRKSEQIKLIMECRRSGLSDYQWCQNQGINPGTFYNRVNKLRKAGYTFPDSESRVSALPVKQEVVKLDMIDSPVSTPVMMEQTVSHALNPDPPQIVAENIKIRFFRRADDTVIQTTLNCIGGMSHAW